MKITILFQADSEAFSIHVEAFDPLVLEVILDESDMSIRTKFNDGDAIVFEVQSGASTFDVIESVSASGEADLNFLGFVNQSELF